MPGEHETPAGAATGSRARSARLVRGLSTLMIVAGMLVAAWAIVVWQWQDPVTGAYARYQQHQLAGSLDREFRAATPPRRPVRTTSAATALRAETRQVAAAAAALRTRARPGQAIGWITVPRIGLHMVLVNGTDHETLKKGPGRDERAFLPGEGQLVYIAGHRTTYLAPFSRIDSLRKGDEISLKMPYATFVYRVSGQRIVTATNMSVLRSRGHEVVELQACHPRFFATHRYIVYALPVRVEPRGGKPYVLARSAHAQRDEPPGRA
jgi:sortase A